MRCCWRLCGAPSTLSTQGWDLSRFVIQRLTNGLGVVGVLSKASQAPFSKQIKSFKCTLGPGVEFPLNYLFKHTHVLPLPLLRVARMMINRLAMQPAQRIGWYLFSIKPKLSSLPPLAFIHILLNHQPNHACSSVDEHRRCRPVVLSSQIFATI